MRHQIVTLEGRPLAMFDGEVPRNGEIVKVYGGPAGSDPVSYRVFAVTWEFVNGDSRATVQVSSS